MEWCIQEEDSGIGRIGVPELAPRGPALEALMLDGAIQHVASMRSSRSVEGIADECFLRSNADAGAG